MKNIIKTISFLTIFALIPAAFAATSRIGVNTKAASRIPSIAGKLVLTANSSSSSSSSTSLLASAECIEDYTDCIQGDDVCGSDMAECTSKTLFHAKMPKCSSVLIQCSTAGINALFGTSDFSQLSNSTGSGEDKVYTYPTDGSVMGQMIVGSEISNRLSTEQCVRRYTNCLHRDDVCGSDFELCTEKTKLFKKQAVLCASTLERCQNEGKTELFGSTTAAKDLKPTDDSRLGVMIKEGAELAALNAVKTCQKVVDNCLVKACSANPWRCIEGIKMGTIDAADIVAGGTTDSITTNSTLSKNGDTISSDYDLYKTTGSDVRKFFKSACLDTIGSNRYCHMTFREKVPSDRELGDIDLQEDVFSLAYSARKEYANVKIQEMLKKFDTDAKNNCSETIKSCAMRSCGGGVGSVCYTQVYGTNNSGLNVQSIFKSVNAPTKTIAGSTTRPAIKTACEAIVDTDPNCIYAYTAVQDSTYEYSYINDDVFDALFPSDGKDPIGVIASLNASLATSYNAAAIANMKKQCANTAVACVKSMCGTDYVNCYRNRTDIVSGTYVSGKANFDKSMNKMGGVLDYNIVIGLCMNTIKNASVCEEHLKIKQANIGADDSAWSTISGVSFVKGVDGVEYKLSNYDSVRDAWAGANTTRAISSDVEVVTGCKIDTKISSSLKCRNKATNVEACDYVDEDGCLYSVEEKETLENFTLSQAATSLFQEVLADVEKEVQAQYNAKLTKEQNTCLAQNNGGVRGANENASTYMWVKLKSNKVPKDYSIKGLSTSGFTETGDLYGGFCRARVTVTSDDNTIQEALANKATAYFAVGDTFTCGSWIDEKTLDKITEKVAEKARTEAGKGGAKEKAALAWSTIGGLLGGGALGFGVTEAMQSKGNSLGGLLKGTESDTENAKTQCLSEVNKAVSAQSAADTLGNNMSAQATKFAEAVSHANNAVYYAKQAGAFNDAKNVPTFTNVSYTPGTEYKAGKWEIRGSYPVLARIAEFDKCTGCTQESGCKESVNRAKSYYNNVSENSAEGIRTELVNANKEGGCGIEIPVVGDDLYVTQIANEQNYAAASSNYDDLKSDFSAKIETVRIACQEAKNSGWSRAAVNGVGAAVGSGVGLALGLGISKTVLDVKYENAANEAVKAWMEEIGDHIHCYIGGEEAGSYGDVVNISFD